MSNLINLINEAIAPRVGPGRGTALGAGAGLLAASGKLYHDNREAATRALRNDLKSEALNMRQTNLINKPFNLLTAGGRAENARIKNLVKDKLEAAEHATPSIGTTLSYAHDIDPDNYSSHMLGLGAAGAALGAGAGLVAKKYLASKKKK